MQARPHLVLDGAVLAAGAVGAEQIVLYIGREHSAAADAMLHALAERPATKRARIRISRAPVAYVSGEETAAVQFVNRGVALPMSVPPRPFEAGVGGRPTLVQNVESSGRRGAHRPPRRRLVPLLGHPAGDRDRSRRPSRRCRDPAGDPRRRGGRESRRPSGVRPGAPARRVLRRLGRRRRGPGPSPPPRAPAGHRPRARLRVVAPLPADRCGVAETARIVSYLAGQSAGQCGPCVFGLGAIAETLRRIAVGRSRPDDLARLDRWSAELPGAARAVIPTVGRGWSARPWGCSPMTSRITSRVAVARPPDRSPPEWPDVRAVRAPLGRGSRSGPRRDDPRLVGDRSDQVRRSWVLRRAASGDDPARRLGLPDRELGTGA